MNTEIDILHISCYCKTVFFKLYVSVTLKWRKENYRQIVGCTKVERRLHLAHGL